MSVKGLLDAEKKTKKLSAVLRRSLNTQAKELKQELQKIEFLLADKDQVRLWRSSPAGIERVNSIIAKLDEVEKLYTTAGNSQAGVIFKDRMKRQLTEKLTNLKANEIEVKVRTELLKQQSQLDVLQALNNVHEEGALRELYTQARQSGGFLSGVGRGYMKDLITLDTKSAGSKTLGKYMANLFNSYEEGLKNVFIKGIVRGDSYKQMENNLMNATNITQRKANMLVRTEANAIFNQSVRNVIEDNPLVKGYRFRSVLDSRTSKICQSMDGKYIPKEEVKPGVNFPPLHPNCRSTVTTVLVSENVKKDTVQRYTKNRNNEWVTVPPGMKYPEFKRRMQEFAGPRQAPRGVQYSSTLTRETSIMPDDHRIAQIGGTKYVPNVPASAALLDNKLGPNVSVSAQVRYDQALAKEQIITDKMIKMADKQGVRLSGVEFSAKTGSSVTEKIERKKNKIAPGEPIPTDEQVVDKMGDLVRYTVVSDHDDLVATTERFIKGFKDGGYIIEELDNKYLARESTYRGIHLQVVDADGQRFEVQVHSEKSLEVKNRNHTLYEEARKPSTSLERRLELDKEMIEVVKSLPRPKDIDKLKSF